MGDAHKVRDEVSLWTRLVTDEGGAQHAAMRLFDRNTLSSCAAAKLFDDGRFDVTDKKLRHGLNVLSLIAVVKCR